MMDSEFGDDMTRPDDPNFSGFPKRPPEDCIRYSVYDVAAKSEQPGTTYQSRKRLKEFQSAASKFVGDLLKDYIWQRDSFQLSLEFEESKCTASSQEPQQGQWMLAGKTEFGDSIADEWIIVYLLRELSRKFTGAWIRVTDGDGEFLLAEAAHAIPSWLDPDVSDHRVWINGGEVKIIPPTVPAPNNSNHSKSSKRPQTISLYNALTYLATAPHDLIRSPSIQKEAFYRLRNYPADIAKSMHVAKAIIPRKLAHILYRNPALVSPAVEAFYLRDTISMKSLQSAASENVTFSPGDFVTMSVRFTRVGFAQLKSQEFPIPPAWRNQMQSGNPDRSQGHVETGIKLSCGFEMLVADPQNQDKKNVREIKLMLEDIDSGDEPLPSDSEIRSWPQTENDENWLDVDFRDLEKELAGKTRGTKDYSADESTWSFGDKGAQENLRRIVQSFEQFLDDDEAGVDGVGPSDESDYENASDENVRIVDLEDDSIGFSDENPFTANLRGSFAFQDKSKPSHSSQSLGEKGIPIPSSAASKSSDENDIGRTADAVEAELRSMGALSLDPMQPGSGRHGNTGRTGEHSDRDSQANLAENLLKSFGGQMGMPGPTGNLLSSMGFKLPRNERSRNR